MKEANALILAAFLVLQSSLPATERPHYTINRTSSPITIDGRLDEPEWFAARDVGPFAFPRWTEGKKEQTVAKLLWDDTNLYLAYLCEDAHIWGEHTERDSAVYLDDAVEVFTAPDPERPHVYFNIEMNVLGIFLDNFHPDGPGVPVERDWNGEGIRISTSILGTLNDDSDEDRYWIVEAAIPLKNFQGVARHTPPRPGDVWHLNLNRLGGKTNRQHSQWSPGGPTFHAPDYFGRVTFSGETVPFGRTR